MKQYDELLDEELEQILGSRYQDATELFTEDAQERRRDHRVMITFRMTAFMLALMSFCAWAERTGLIAARSFGIGIGLCCLVIGYSFGVCVSHLKGWRD